MNSRHRRPHVEPHALARDAAARCSLTTRMPLISERITEFYNHYCQVFPEMMNLTSVRCVVRGIRVHNGEVALDGRSLPLGEPVELSFGDIVLLHDSSYVAGRNPTRYPAYHSAHNTELRRVNGPTEYPVRFELLMRDLGAEPLHRVTRFIEERLPCVPVIRTGTARRVFVERRSHPSPRTNMHAPSRVAHEAFLRTPCIYRR